MSTQRTIDQMPDTRNVNTQQMPTVEGARRADQAPTGEPAGMQGTQRIQEMPDEGRLVGRLRGSETKPAVRTTEFWIYLLAIAGTLLASQLVGRDDAGVDVFRADRAWWYIALLTIGYLLSRGLSKAGSSWRGAGGRGR